MEIQSVLRWSLPGLSDKQRERAVLLFLRKKSSFAVVEGTLYLSYPSMELVKSYQSHVMMGTLDVSE